MVWQLPCVDGGGDNKSKGGRPSFFPDIVVEAAEEAANAAGDSLASSSLDLVPVSLNLWRNTLALLSQFYTESGEQNWETCQRVAM